MVKLHFKSTPLGRNLQNCWETNAALATDQHAILTDYTGGKLGVVYHLASTTLGHKITLKVDATIENPHVQSVEAVWKTADWHEREAYDMIWIVFDGHPDLRRMLCPYDWEGHPLRKDYQVPEYYNGMKVPS